MPQIDFDVLFQLIYDLLTGGYKKWLTVWPGLPQVLFWYKIFSYIFTVIGGVFAVSLFLKISKIKAAWYEPLKRENINVVPEATLPINPHWAGIVAKMQTENESDWQWAIIEADKILDEMVKKMGYPGDNLGERLKAVEPSDFITLNEAWEAHKVRNQIAHEPGFQLTKRIAQQTIGRFEKVFKEFSYI